MTWKMIIDYYMVVVCTNVRRMLPMKIQILLKKSEFTTVFCSYLSEPTMVILWNHYQPFLKRKKEQRTFLERQNCNLNILIFIFAFTLANSLRMAEYPVVFTFKHRNFSYCIHLKCSYF